MHRSNFYRGSTAMLLAVCVAWSVAGCYAKRTLVVEPGSRQTERTSPAVAGPGQAAPGPSNSSPRADTARDFLLAWHLERGLPGLAKGAAGSLEETLKVHANDSGLSASRLFRFTPNNEAAHYFYALEHTDSGWQLTRAWKTDTGGKLVQQFEVR